MLLWPQLVQFNLFGVREGKIAVGDRRRDAVDMLVGHNIRILREDRGISQTELGRKIGVVFQQVQKYENGENRVCCGRLFKIASALDAPITAFFEGVDQSISADAASSPVSLLADPMPCVWPTLSARWRARTCSDRWWRSPSIWRGTRFPLSVRATVIR